MYGHFFLSTFQEMGCPLDLGLSGIYARRMWLVQRKLYSSWVTVGRFHTRMGAEDSYNNLVKAQLKRDGIPRKGAKQYRISDDKPSWKLDGRGA